MLLFGGGGHCKSCIEAIESYKKYEISGIVLSKPNSSGAVFNYQILGTDDELVRLKKISKFALVTVGQIKSADLRRKLYQKLKNSGFVLPFIVAKTAYISPRAGIASGSICLHGSVVNSAAAVGANCIINTRAVVEHDAVVSDHCHISTGAILNGGVYVGSGSFIGSGSIIREGVKIGVGSFIGAGQVITKDLPDGAFYTQGGSFER